MIPENFLAISWFLLGKKVAWLSTIGTQEPV
jgi:hypothetical protein